MPTTPPAPTVYHEGHVKRDPVTNAVALRTIFPEDQGEQLAAMAWLVATANVGARHSNTAGVASWDDVYVAPPAETPFVPGDPNAS